MMIKRRVEIHLVYSIFLIGSLLGAVIAQTTIGQFPTVVASNFIANHGYGFNFHISNDAEYVYGATYSSDEIYQRETNTYLDFIGCDNEWCFSTYAEWAPNNALLAVNPQNSTCYPNGNFLVALFEISTELLATRCLTIPIPPENQNRSILHWSPFSPTQLAVQGHYMFDLKTEQGISFVMPDVLDLSDIGAYVFYQRGVWSNETQSLVGEIDLGACCPRKINICTSDDSNDCQILYGVDDDTYGYIMDALGNEHWLLWHFNRFKDNVSIWQGFEDTELYLTDLLTGETELLLRLSDVEGLPVDNLRGIRWGLAWSPDRNTIALGLENDAHEEQGFLLITLDWGEDNE